ncbi:hypothetical protein PR202_gb28133 [Eleusine coracana subsp. coracana]|uniref:Protein kinase domain-containing protein n=1 Tax=Eleusine coracana subsp. coracana TaxID=191504 RepID=A0AAV5FTT4_ELECO|nr:hypothetical protein PR202_gb28133 [Eleusine coracana subsp. coracana]
MGGCFSLEEHRLPRRPAEAAGPDGLGKCKSDSKARTVLAPPKDVEDLQVEGYGNVNIFTYNELRAATKNFRPDQILGEGGFGVVYKGVIDENVRAGFPSRQVAVKELNPEGFQGDKEWLLLVLRCLISNIISDSQCHSSLLQDYNAKLSDFGLARTGPSGDQTHVSTRVMGTYGYAAPEYVMTGHLTARSDVYGFGVVLLEMIIGRRAVDKSRPTREHNLVEWARPLLVHNRKLFRIIDPRMEGQYSTKAAIEVASLAYRCLSQNPKGRPTMSQVVETFEAVQNMPECQDVLLQNCITGAVTLYEVPKEPAESVEPEKAKLEPTIKPDVVPPVNGKPVPTSRRTRPGNGRSKSETALESKLYIPPSPDSDGPGLEVLASPSRNGNIKDPPDEDLYKI